MKPYKLSNKVMDRVNSLEEFAEEILFIAHPKLWEVDCSERVVTPYLNKSDKNVITLEDWGIGSNIFEVEALDPTTYINVPVDKNQLDYVIRIDGDFDDLKY